MEQLEQLAVEISGEFDSLSIETMKWAYGKMNMKPGERMLGLLKHHTRKRKHTAEKALRLEFSPL